MPSITRRAAEVLGFVAPPTSAPAEIRSDITVPPARPTGQTLTPDTALGIAAVYRAVQILVTSASSMEMDVYTSGRRMATTPALIRTPDVNDTQRGFVESTVFSLAVHGNAYWLATGDPVVSLRVLDPATVSWSEDPDTLAVTYFVRGRQVASSKIKHLRLMRKPGTVAGLGPIQAAAGELTAILRLREFADNWFGSGVPTGALSTDQVLGPEESKAFAEAWKKFLAESNGVAVLSQGLSYSPVRIKPAEAQFLEVQQAAVVTIARLFGVPATYLLAETEGSSSTYVNQQELGLIYLQTTLTRYLNAIEDALSAFLPGRQTVQFRESQLLRMSPQVRVEIQTKQIESGLRSADELRAEDGLAPLPKPDPAPAPPAPEPQPDKEIPE